MRLGPRVLHTYPIKCQSEDEGPSETKLAQDPLGVSAARKKIRAEIYMDQVSKSASEGAASGHSQAP